jgi:hypothetical protein
VKTRSLELVLRTTSILFILLAIVLTVFSLVQYSRQRERYPIGMTIAGVPVGGLTPQEAVDRLLRVYNTPLEIRYGDAVFQMSPEMAGFQMDVESMIAAADQVRKESSFWQGFWNYLWGQNIVRVDIPLRATLSKERLREYLVNEISARYDEPPTPPQPVPGSTTFTPPKPGRVLDVENALLLIEQALRSPTQRRVELVARRALPGRADFKFLEILLQQNILQMKFDGVIGVYLQDLQSGNEIHFAYDRMQAIPVQPADVVFTAASTIKIPILVAFFIANRKAPLSPQIEARILDMIHLSENPPADDLMNRIDPLRGPLVVTESMRRIGLKNTFIAGYFAPGSPLLARITTPANSRTDVWTDPDPYNQTTPLEMGLLLADLYQCATHGSGSLIAVFPESIDKDICQKMIDFLAEDRIGKLLEAGLPEGTRIAHKHGWVTDVDGVIRNYSDAGLIYTPGGDFVLSVYAYHPVQILDDTANVLFARLASTAYNYYNVPLQP